MRKVILMFLLGLSSLVWAQEDKKEKKVNKDELIGATENVSGTAVADSTEGWKTGGVIGVNFTNVGLQNWAAGGANSYSVSGLLGLEAKYVKGKNSWDNSADFGFGIIQQFTPGAPSEQRRWIKSDDKIDLNSKYGRQLSEKWYYTALLNFKTQFADGFSNPQEPNRDSLKVISRFLAPAYAIAAIGMDFKPSKEFSGLIAPITAKVTIVADEDLSNAGAFGVEEGRQLRSEIGLYMRYNYSKEVAKNIKFSTKLEWFQNYQRFRHIDINRETLTSMKVNEYVSVTFNTLLIYDDDIHIAIDENRNGTIDGNVENHARVQFKHVFSAGFNYKF